MQIGELVFSVFGLAAPALEPVVASGFLVFVFVAALRLIAP